jgi:hypothetical protein
VEYHCILLWNVPFIVLFIKVMTCILSIELVKMILNDEFEGLWKEGIMAYFKIVLAFIWRA